MASATALFSGFPRVCSQSIPTPSPPRSVGVEAKWASPHPGDQCGPAMGQRAPPTPGLGWCWGEGGRGMGQSPELLRMCVCARVHSCELHGMTLVWG